MARERDNEDYEAANRALIAREERKLEKAKDRAEALERNAAKALSKALKVSKNNLKKEMVNSVRRSDSGNLSPVERALIEAVQSGSDRVFIDEGVITGEDEARDRVADLFDDEDDEY
jgi:hypothetical protein